MKVFEYDTKVSLARPNSNSGRTTIPKEIMKFLDMKIGDSINWEVRYTDGVTEVIVSKKEK